MSTDINIKAAARPIEPETLAGKSSVRKIVFVSHSNPEDNDFTKLGSPRAWHWQAMRCGPISPS